MLEATCLRPGEESKIRNKSHPHAGDGVLIFVCVLFSIIKNPFGDIQGLFGWVCFGFREGLKMCPNFAGDERSMGCC